MLKHIVLMKFTPDPPEGAVDEIMEALRAMPAEIPEILSLAVGTNVVQSPRNLDLGLVVEFDSQESLEIYAVHQAHQSVVQERIRPILEQLVVVDFEE